MDGTWYCCVILAVDIEGFGSPMRSDPLRASLRRHLHQYVDHSLMDVGVSPRQVLLRHDLGDGVLILLDPDLPLRRLLDVAVNTLASRLANHNRVTPSQAARLRLRVAVHRGALIRDAHGYTGHALNHAFRLLDAEVVRITLAHVRGGLVVVISDHVHDALCRSDGRDTSTPTDYQPLWVSNKETTSRGWLHVPGESPQPLLPAILRAADTAAASLGGHRAPS